MPSSEVPSRPQGALGATPLPLRPLGSDEAARVRLRRNRALATGMLAGMGGVFIATSMVPNPGFMTLLVRSGAEAGIVGGLADWFAVTALFRRPFGLPIPHTAIIPSNKDRIGRTLGRFVERNFLTREVLLRKLREIRVGERFAAWLVAPGTASLIASSITRALPYFIRSMGSHDLREFVQRTLGEQLREADLSPIVGRAIRILTASGEADVLFERILGIAVRWLESNRDQLDALVSERSRWWIPKAIDRRIAAVIVNSVTELLNSLREPDSETRVKFREALEGVVDELLSSTDQRDQINASKDRFLSHPDVQAWLGSVWKEFSHALLEDLAQPSSRLRSALEKGITLAAQTLASDTTMQRHVDEFVEQLARYLITWRGEIGSFIAEVVKSWDTRTLSDRLELVVGSDLQYIRMNGTIVGACAGCLIFVATRLFG
jgi:uncharacterized membrane-anchored protein YjiN (DUF445 family)